jgi:ubiquinone biosynthesis protein COQ9
LAENNLQEDKAMATKTKAEPYQNRVADRLKELRKSNGWSMDELREKLRAAGFDAATSTLYGYERHPEGDKANGVCLPVELVPVIAEVYGYSSAHGWLPR